MGAFLLAVLALVLFAPNSWYRTVLRLLDK